LGSINSNSSNNNERALLSDYQVGGGASLNLNSNEENNVDRFATEDNKNNQNFKSKIINKL
jgi:hypothetical protein